MNCVNAKTCVVFPKSGQRLQNMIVSNVMSSLFPLSHMTECTMLVVNVILLMQRSSSVSEKGKEKNKFPVRQDKNANTL